MLFDHWTIFVAVIGFVSRRWISGPVKNRTPAVLRVITLLGVSQSTSFEQDHTNTRRYWWSYSSLPKGADRTWSSTNPPPSLWQQGEKRAK